MSGVQSLSVGRDMELLLKGHYGEARNASFGKAGIMICLKKVKHPRPKRINRQAGQRLITRLTSTSLTIEVA